MSIARHELRQAWRSGVVPVLASVLVLLLVGAAAVGRARAREDESQRQRYQAMVTDQWLAQPDRHPHRVAHYGFLVFRPPAALGFVDSGVEGHTGTSLFLEAHRQNSANFSDAAQSDGTRRFGELTLAIVLQLLVPLLLFAIAGVSITRERELGTLWMLLCAGVDWRRVLAGKALGVFALVAVLVMPGLALTALSMGMAGSGAWSGDTVIRVVLLVVCYALFLGVCALLVVAMSARHRTSRGALITLFALWVALFVVLPRALPSVAAALAPLPSRAAFEADVERTLRELGDSHNPDDPRFARLRADTLAKHGVSRVEDLPFNYNGLVMQEGEALSAAAYQRHIDRLLASYRRHDAVVQLAAVLSPYVAMRTVSMALAGVDVSHALEFERRAEEYRYLLIQELNDLHQSEVAHAQDRYVGLDGGGAPTRQRIDREHFRGIPTFEYEPPSAMWAVAAAPVPFVALVGWLTAAILLLWRRTPRPVMP